MTENELAATLAALAGTDRRVYAALREAGKMTDRMLREELGSRGSGPRNALEKLLELGLVRPADKAQSPGRPQLYERTPLGEVEQQAAKYGARKPRRREAKGTPASSRLGRLRRQEQGNWTDWQHTRRRILEETMLLYSIDKMAFWNVAPEDELEFVLDEVVALREWCDQVLCALGQRRADDSKRRKIEKMIGNLNGRTPAEIAALQKKAAELRSTL